MAFDCIWVHTTHLFFNNYEYAYSSNVFVHKNHLRLQFTFKSILGPTHTLQHSVCIIKILNMIKRWCEDFTSNMQTATQSKEHISFAMFGTRMIEDLDSILSFCCLSLFLCLQPPWLVERDHEYPMLENSFSPSLIYTRNNNPATYQLFYKKLRNQTICKKLPHSVQDHIFPVPNFKWKRFKSSSTEIHSSFCQTVLFVKVSKNLISHVLFGCFLQWISTYLKLPIVTSRLTQNCMKSQNPSTKLHSHPSSDSCFN